MTTYQERHAEWVAQHNMTKDELRTAWVAKARDFISSAMELTIIWEHLDTEDNDTTGSDIYPFSSSFDEDVYAFGAWLEDIEEKWGK